MLKKILRMITGGASLSFDPRAGQLVSVLVDDGEIGVMKLLAVDRAGVHGRVYVQRFASRPADADAGELTLAPLSLEGDQPFSIGHIPLSRGTFAGWEPVLMGERPVSDDELDGYRMWREENGGYF